MKNVKTKLNIKKTYSDMLYWVRSSVNKKKDYYLTPSEADILRKLIHYSKKNEKITYSNEIISSHTFIPEVTIKDVIPKLNRIGYINSATTTIKDGQKWIRRRTIYIDWEFLETVMKDIPVVNETPQVEVIKEAPEVVESQEIDSLIDTENTQPEVEIEDDIDFNEVINHTNEEYDTDFDEYTDIVIKQDSKGRDIRIKVMHFPTYEACKHMTGFMKRLMANTTQYGFNKDLEEKMESLVDTY